MTRIIRSSLAFLFCLFSVACLLPFAAILLPQLEDIVSRLRASEVLDWRVTSEQLATSAGGAIMWLIATLLCFANALLLWLRNDIRKQFD